MSNSAQFTSAPASASSSRPPALPHCRPEEMAEYVHDIFGDLLSGDPERQEDGLRRLCIEALETGALDFQATGEIARTRERDGMFAAVTELSLYLLFPDRWPADWLPVVRMGRVEAASAAAG